MRKIILIAATILTVSMVFGCAKKKALDYGTITDGVYYNEFFSFSMEIPEEMHITYHDGIDKMVRDANMGKLIIDSNSEMFLLISARNPYYTDSLFNYNITIGAEKIPVSSSIKNNAQYAAQMVKLFEQTSSVENISAVLGNTQLGGRDFTKYTVRLINMEQDIYTRYHNGYVLVIGTSYSNEDERDSIARILSTIAFKA